MNIHFKERNKVYFVLIGNQLNRYLFQYWIFGFGIRFILMHFIINGLDLWIHKIWRFVYMKEKKYGKKGKNTV